MARYLSLEWIDDLRTAVAEDDVLGAAAEGRHVGVTQVVTDGPEGDVVYHLQVVDGDVVFGAGPAEPEDICFVQDWDTAVAVATSTLNAQEAFITGRIRLTGDPELLLASTPLFAALDRVFSSVRTTTTYE
jgi:hypothetical protein